MVLARALNFYKNREIEGSQGDNNISLEHFYNSYRKPKYKSSIDLSSENSVGPNCKGGPLGEPLAKFYLSILSEFLIDRHICFQLPIHRQPSLVSHIRVPGGVQLFHNYTEILVNMPYWITS